MITQSDVLEYPLSIGQEHLRFLDRLGAESAVHNRCFALRILGPLRIDLLERAVELIVARHEPLRTRFPTRDGVDVQSVEQPSPVKIDLDVVDGLDAARIAARDEFLRPFDLAVDDPVRLKLLRVDHEDHVLLTSVHHMNFDGWSERVFLSELSEIYGALSSNRAPELEPIVASYGEIAGSSRAEIEAGRFDEELDYWTRQLAEPRVGLELPTDVPPPATPRHRGARQPFHFPAELRSAIDALGRSERATTFATLVAILSMLLHRYTGEEDIIIGTHVAGRHTPESEALIGLFINTLALRIDLSGSPTFRELLVRSRNTVLAALSRQKVPFGEVVRRLNPERRCGRTPLFSVTVQWRNFPVEIRTLGALRFERFDVETGLSRIDLALETRPDGGGIAGSAEYDTDLFERATVERMLGHYRNLAEAAVADPDRPISALPMLSDDERRSVLSLWRGIDTDYRPDAACHTIVEEHVDRRPDAIAIIDGDRRIRYAEMNARANRLAHRLIELGVTPGSPVALMFDRSAELVVATLAIVKAGAFYVPLDRHWPASRVKMILADTGARFVVSTTDDPGHDLASVARLVTLDISEPLRDDAAPDNPEISTRSTDPIYVMYTSGSTGRPKGVMIEHRAVNRLLVNTDFIDIGPDDVVGCCASVVFDGSTFEMWGPLMSGASLAVVPQLTLLSPTDFESLLQREKVSVLFLTTSLASFFVQDRPAMFRNVRVLLLGGDAVDRSFRSAFEPDTRPARVVDAYGPTEATVFAIAHEIEDDPFEKRLVPIGRPIANSIAGILDNSGEPAAVGVPGEICLGGPGLARGYLNDPERTAEKFIADRFTSNAEARLYRTGDRGRFRNDGRIEYLGRLDRQVKIRGYRIEPGEIQSVLESHPAVDRAVVVPVGSGNERRIGAWVKLRRDADPANIRSWLCERLPEFMMPARIVPIDRFPLTPSGKLDVAALSLPAERRAPSRPLTETERRVADVWNEVLDRDAAVADMDFFDAGGDSLGALRLLSMLRERFDREMPVDKFFMHPTIEAVASWLSSEPVLRVDDPGIVTVHSAGEGTEAFLIPGGGGAEQELFVLVPFFRMLAVQRPIHGLRSKQLLDAHWNAEAFVQRHVEEVLLRRCEPPWILLGECVGGILAWEVAAELEAIRPGSTRLVLLDTRYPDVERLKRFEHLLTTPVTTRARIVHHARALGKGRLPKLNRVFNVLRGVEPLNDSEGALHNARYARFLMGIEPAPRDGNTFFIVSEESGVIDDIPRWQRMSRGRSRVVTVPGNHRTYLRADSLTTARALDDILDGI